MGGGSDGSDGFEVGAAVRFNKEEWTVRHVLSDAHGAVRLALLNTYQYLTGVRPERCTLIRRAGEPSPDTHPYTYAMAMNGWRVGDEVAQDGQAGYVVSGLAVDTNGCLHIYVMSPHTPAREAYGALTLVRRENAEED